MSLVDIVNRADNNSTLDMLIHKMFHDIASPLNTVMMGIDILESGYDAAMLGYTKDGVSKMAAILALFRLLLKDDTDIAISDIETNVGVLCRFSISSSYQSINADLGRMVICVLYGILLATAKISSISCNISNDNVHILTVAQDVFCEFKPSEQPTKKNIFQHVALLIAKATHRNLVAQNTKEGFLVSF